MTVVATGAVVPEVLLAADELDAEVIRLTSADLVLRALQARAGLGGAIRVCSRPSFPRPARS